MNGPATLPGLLRGHARRRPTEAAMREKKLGIWQTATWADAFAETRAIAFGLAALGFEPGEKLCVLGDNRPGLYWSQFAAQSLGGVAVPLDPSRPAADLVHSLADLGTCWVVVENEEQLERLLPAAAGAPELRHILVGDPGVRAETCHAPLCTIDHAKALGQKRAEQEPDLVDRMIDDLAGESIAVQVHLPCDTMVTLSHQALIAAATAFARDERIRSNDEWLAYLPMAWVTDALFSVALALTQGFACSCPEGPETVLRDLVELGPHGFFAPAKLWAALRRSAESRAARSSPVNRTICGFFLGISLAAERRREAGKTVGLPMRAGIMLGEMLVHAAIRDKLGLGRCRWAYTDSSGMDPETLRFFGAVGLAVKRLEPLPDKAKEMRVQGPLTPGGSHTGSHGAEPWPSLNGG